MLRRINWRRYGLVIVTLPVVILVFIASAFAPVIAPYDPYALDVLVMLEGPSDKHLLGTDELGRDILSRVIQASRISIVVGLVAVGIGAFGGTLIGMLAAWFGGKIDAVLMRFMDIVFCFPAILLAVILMANLGTSVLNAMLAIGIIFIPGFARLTRAVAQTVQRQSFLEAAICLGRARTGAPHHCAKSCPMSSVRSWSRPPSPSPTPCFSNRRCRFSVWAPSLRSRHGAT